MPGGLFNISVTTLAHALDVWIHVASHSKFSFGEANAVEPLVFSSMRACGFLKLQGKATANIEIGHVFLKRSGKQKADPSTVCCFDQFQNKGF